MKVRLININPILKYSFSTNTIDVIGIEVLNLKNSFSIYFWFVYIPNDSHVSFESCNSSFYLVSNNCFMESEFNAHHPTWGSSFVF